ncbi:MAG: TetR family transcriptional regulator [Sinimarinibacterium sp.]|jgi:AcrR family transcriptional regulator
MSTPLPRIDDPADVPDGKRRLIEAAMRLAVQGTGFSALGIRELAREAGLNHNTFYRHFDTLEELTQAVARKLSRHLMDGLREVRANAARHGDATQGAVDYFLDFVARDPGPIIVGLRELHGGSPGIRRSMRQIVEEIATESVEQIVSMELAPGLSAAALLHVTRPITYYMFYRALDFIDTPQRRAEIAADMVRFIRQQFLGALSLEGAR